MDLTTFKQYIPLLVPVLMIQLALMIAGLMDLVRREHTRGPKWVWALVIVLGEVIGPIVYFVFGRREE
jgi:uncharacterized membrane protein YhaH (DUF805 family)